MSGENFDYCEYVYNPLMRQYQAMLRLMQIISDSQSQEECNDIECFSPNDPNSPTNVLNSAGGSSSLFGSYMPMLVLWMLFAATLYLFRPQSMRKKPVQLKGTHPASDEHSRSRPRFHDDNDDDSFAS